ncbi:MAG: Ubiquinone/menaquinone biosynthesis C-methyltransferase UbiE [Candidatus Woesearchaeota archaeon]|nr:Ubiquinone/menaquinone biosynthesis C-methyltransferase UbiE [Candidatus Woesearchaeota archaeon]
MSTEKAESVRETEKAPPIYQVYIKKEKEWIERKITHTKSLIDVGCGEGRATAFLSPLTDKYVGIDLNSKAISKAKKLENNKIAFKVVDVTKMSEIFPENAFETSMCLWNTIGNIEKDNKAIEEMYKITSEKCFITTLKRGNLKERTNYYNSYGVKFEVDEENEIFYSDAWGISRSYDKEEFKKMCEAVGFKVVEIVDLGKIAFGIELKK